MTIEQLREDLLQALPVREALRELEVRFVVEDLPAIDRGDGVDLDWNRLLLLASVLLGGRSEEAVTGALRIAQGCLISNDVSATHRTAAAVLLERMGNLQSVELAERRELIAPDSWQSSPVPMQLDVVRRRLELSVSTGVGPRRAVNPFQRRFWDLVEQNDWVSVSAPTSAGKSWIVMRWFERKMREADSFRGFYIVPTRALVEEVALSLEDQLQGDVVVQTIPWDLTINEQPREIYVMTQERAHLLLQRLSDLSADVVFVDEAQKFADDSRGVLLQRALADLVRRDPRTQIIFASPMSANPELLVRDAPVEARTAAEVVEAATVNQTLLWADATRGRPKHWTLRAPTVADESRVGTFELGLSPSRVSQRLPVVAFSLAGASAGNVVYVNGPADAEKAALQIAELIGREVDTTGDHEIASLIELVTGSIHPQYALAAALRRRVAFHYGNMPLLVRAEIERLFRAGVVRYLICTSTLLEGVNLPCRNLFVRGPRRGRGNPMTSADFWNLAGRAGRWGTEFQGNIVCVDVKDAVQWPDPPRTRTRTLLRRATDDELVGLDELVEHARRGAPALEDERAHDLREAMMSFLAVQVARGEPLASLAGLQSADVAKLKELEDLLRQAVEQAGLPIALLERHAGISPQAMRRLFDAFATEPLVELLVEEPAVQNASVSYQAALRRCGVELGAPFGGEKRQWQLAYLITDWMRGRPLAYLIRRRIELDGGRKKVDALIRETMTDVENFARFHAPKFLACYLDLLRVFLTRSGKQELADAAPNLDMLLELGVSQPTQMTLLGLGLSRTSVIAVTEFLLGENLTRDECVEWLRTADLDSLSLPELVRRELIEARARHSGEETSHR